MDEIDLNDDAGDKRGAEADGERGDLDEVPLQDTRAASGAQHKLAPKTSAEVPKLPEATQHISLDDDEGGGPTDNGTVGSHAPGVEVHSAASSLGQPPPKPPAPRPDTENGTVGSKVSPPNPYSEEGSRAAEQRLAEEVAQREAEGDSPSDSPVGPTSNGDTSRPQSPAAAQVLAETEADGGQGAAAAPMDHPHNSMDSFGLASRRGPWDDPQEPVELRGMLYFDGVDSLGRPVIVVNADAVASNVSRQWACTYIQQRLEPIVSQGPYVLVMVNSGSKAKRLPASWLISAHRSLSRPFRKNVKYIVLVRPSGMLKALLAFIRPFVSGKAHRKVRKVESLSGIATATNHEVTIQHLGPRFAAAAGRFIADGLAKPPVPGQPVNSVFAMPSVD